MIVYIIAFFVIIGLYKPLQKTENKKKMYCIIICVMLTLIVGLRNVDLGLTDTQYVYYPRFNQIASHPFSYIFTLKDYGFQTLTFLFTRIFGERFKLYTTLFALPYIGSVSFLIYKYSSKAWLSFILFMCLQYYEISFTLMRQVLGMAFLCIALHFFIQEKYKSFVVMVLLAALFHQVCIVFLIVLGIRFIRPKKWMLIPLIIIIGLCLLYPERLLGFAYRLIEYDRFARYSVIGKGKNLTFFFMNVVIFVANYLAFEKIKKKREMFVFFVCSCICLAISPLTIALGEMTRVAYIFGLFNIVLIPESLKQIKGGRSRTIVTVSYTLVFIAYFLAFLGPQVRIIPYYM